MGCSLAPSPVAPSPGRPTAHGELGCSKDHPDPRGANLSRVARALKALLTDPNNPYSITRLGVFWDFGSLHQHPDPTNGVLRTDEQNALFKQGALLPPADIRAAADLLPGRP